MTKRIYKYPLTDNKGVQSIQMQVGAVIRHCGAQHGRPCLWVEIDTDAPYLYQDFRVYQTGDPIEPGGVFIGTVLVSDTYVLHVYKY